MKRIGCSFHHHANRGTLASSSPRSRNMMRAFSVAVLTVALAACSSTPMAQVQPIDGVISGQCHSDMVRGALGLAASDATVARARVDSDSLHVRVLRHDGPRVPPASEGGDRLTIEKGRTNNIVAIYCG